MANQGVDGGGPWTMIDSRKFHSLQHVFDKSMFRHVEPVVTPIRDFCGVVVRIDMRGMHAEYSESQSSNETFIERIFAMHFHVVACYPGPSRAPL